LEAGSVPFGPNFRNLTFGEPSSGFTPGPRSASPDMGGGGGRGLLQLDIHSLDGLKNGKTGLVRVHGWQGTRVTVVNF
jgi:hypothetical protein